MSVEEHTTTGLHNTYIVNANTVKVSLDSQLLKHDFNITDASADSASVTEHHIMTK